MKTSSIEAVAETLQAGGIALAPTETVVGLLAAEPGRHRLAEIKGRDPEKPVALLCATPQEAFEMAEEVPTMAQRLAERYWPGSLTLVLKSPGGGTIGVRVPDHEVVVGLLEAYGGPLYATSANLAGEPAPADLDRVDRRILEVVDAIVEGETGVGEASAVVDLTEEKSRLLRASAEITEDSLLQMHENIVRE